MSNIWKQVVSNLTQNFGKHYDQQLEITIGHLGNMSWEFTAGSAFEKYIITYYEKYAKWYFLNKLYENAKDDQGGWSEAFRAFYKEYKKQVKDGVDKNKCYENLQEEIQDTYTHIPESKMPWSMHRIPRSMEVATEYAVFLVETYQELHYLFSQTNFCYGYLDSAGMLLTNNDNWWQQVQRMIAAGPVETATDQSNILFYYYDNKDYISKSNMLWDTLQMSGNIQETLLAMGENYQSRSYHIAVGLDLEGVRTGQKQDVFTEQFVTSKKEAQMASWGEKLFLPYVFVFVIALVLSLYVAGWKNGREQICLIGLDELWLEILFLGLYFVIKVYIWTVQMWAGSLVRIEFAITWVVLFLLEIYILRTVFSIIKRMKARCLLKKSVFFRFWKEIVFGKWKLREIGIWLQTLFWELPLSYRYATVFLVEGGLQGGVLLCLYRGIQKETISWKPLLFNGYGLMACLLYGIFLVSVFALQLRKYYREKIDRDILRKIEKIAEGDFALHMEYPLGISYEQKHLIYLLNRIGTMVDVAVEQSVKSERMKTELIANVSHDIKTPLTSIINYVDLMKRQKKDAVKMQEYMDILERKSQRLKVLIEDLIEASKASSGAMELDMQPLDFVELVQQTNGEFLDSFEEVDLELLSEIPETSFLFLGDGRRVYRVLENLYMNTRKYALPGTRVYVTVSCKQKQVLFSMKNVSREKLNITPEELTERFVRGDSSRSTEGSGLGLSIAKSLTELMGGEFQILLDGDLFRVEVRFPVYQKEEENVKKNA